MRCAVIFFALISCVYARLGENRGELVERLGKVQLESKHFIATQGQLSPLGPALFFKKDQWQIQCDMVNEQCVKITYSKPGDWTADQIQTLLRNNSVTDDGWIETRDSTKMIRKWARRDGGTAKWQFTGAMEFISSAYMKAKAEREAELKSKAEKKPDL